MNALQCKDYAVYVGADISKNTINLSYHSKDNLVNTQIANDSKAIKKFIKEIKELNETHLHFILEATGSYSRTLYTTLRDLKIRFTQVNPRFTYAFARSRGVLDKTDKIDAQLLEDYGRRMTPAAPIPDEDIQIELMCLSSFLIHATNAIAPAPLTFAPPLLSRIFWKCARMTGLLTQADMQGMYNAVRKCFRPPVICAVL